MNELIELAKNHKKIIFHCHYSAVRGPKSSLFFQRAFLNSKFAHQELEILVLRGGFGNWSETYGSDPTLYTKI